MCALQRGVGPQGNVASGVMPREIPHSWTTWEGTASGAETTGLLRGILGRGQSHRGISGMGPAGAVVGPGSSGADWEKVKREVTWCRL